MWKNGKEGNTEGRRIMEGKDGRRETEDGRWETIEAEEKNGAKEKVGRCGRRGKGSGRTGKKKRAGSGMNVVGKSEWEETK